MSEDSINIKTPLISFGFTKKDHILEIEEGAMYLIRSWSWKRLGFTYKVLHVINGEVIVKVIRR